MRNARTSRKVRWARVNNVQIETPLAYPAVEARVRKPARFLLFGGLEDHLCALLNFHVARGGLDKRVPLATCCGRSQGDALHPIHAHAGGQQFSAVSEVLVSAYGRVDICLSHSAAVLQGIEPSLTFLAGPSTGFKVVSVVATPGVGAAKWWATAKSKSGTCFGIEDSSGAAGGTTYAGTTTAVASATCDGSGADPGFPDASW